VNAKRFGGIVCSPYLSTIRNAQNKATMKFNYHFRTVDDISLTKIAEHFDCTVKQVQDWAKLQGPDIFNAGIFEVHVGHSIG
tara:strand:- start:199 stop:444 length:246 start_codon:yes stop_codon:yes gene_type:complete